MSVIDLANKLNVLPPGASFAQVVAIALASALETLRANNALPRRDGFEFNEMMASFSQGSQSSARARALQISATMKLASSEVATPTVDIPANVQTPDPLRRTKARWEELCFKSNNDPLNMTDEDREELMTLTRSLT